MGLAHVTVRSLCAVVARRAGWLGFVFLFLSLGERGFGLKVWFVNEHSDIVEEFCNIRFAAAGIASSVCNCLSDGDSRENQLCFLLMRRKYTTTGFLSSC